MPKLSIVVPVYNVKPYLCECIESILHQSFQDFEVILVDDGSTDGSGAICDAYAAEHDRIHVIHKENGGVSSARNRGIRAAKGAYIWFLDGDDTAVEDGIKTVMAQIAQRNPEITVCGMNLSADQMQTFTPLDYTFTPGIDRSCDYLEVMSDLYQNRDGMWSASRSIYKREFLVKSGIVFDIGLHSAEDCDFHMRVFQKAKSFLFVREPILNYRMNRQNSLSTEKDFTFVWCSVQIYIKWITFFVRLPDKKPAEVIVKRLANRLYAEINDAFYLNNRENRENIFVFVWKNRSVLKFISGKKRKFFSLFYRFFGLRIGRLLYLATHRNKI